MSSREHRKVGKWESIKWVLPRSEETAQGPLHLRAAVLLCKRSVSLGEIIMSKLREATEQRWPAINSGHSSKLLRVLDQLSSNREIKSGTSKMLTLSLPRGFLFVTLSKSWLLTHWIFVTPRVKSIRSQDRWVGISLPQLKTISTPITVCSGPGCSLSHHLAARACL